MRFSVEFQFAAVFFLPSCFSCYTEMALVLSCNFEWLEDYVHYSY